MHAITLNRHPSPAYALSAARGFMPDPRYGASRPDPNAPDLDDDGHLEPDFPCTLAPFGVVAVEDF
jgi:hypothetical protein